LLRACALAGGPGNFPEGALLLGFGNEQSETISKAEYAEDPEEVGESDVTVAGFEVLIALHGDAGSLRDFGLSPVPLEALGAQPREQRPNDEAVASTCWSSRFSLIHITYYIRHNNHN
jgi:hypothetical protein